MTFCAPARDAVLTNRQTEKLNFDTNYITISFIIYSKFILVRDWSKAHDNYRYLEAVALFQLLTPSACMQYFF
jgi:glutaredoxin-related protein